METQVLLALLTFSSIFLFVKKKSQAVPFIIGTAVAFAVMLMDFNAQQIFVQFVTVMLLWSAVCWSTFNRAFVSVSAFARALVLREYSILTFIMVLCIYVRNL
jgi:hypothetical protein